MKKVIAADKSQVIVFKQSACLACVTVDGALLMVSQFRKVHGASTLELPGGNLEEGESEMDAATREMFEETGVRVGNLQRLFVLDMDFSTSIHKTAVFACNMTEDRHHVKAREGVVPVPLKEAVLMCFDGRVTHAPTVAAILALAHREK